MKSTEIWKPVVGYEDEYEVSNLGQVRRVKAAQGAKVGAILAQQELKKRGGYLSVGLSKAGAAKKRITVHRIVAMAFLGPTELPLVRHIDGNPKNNNVDNLRFGTPFENARDRVRHGRSSMNNQNSAKTHCLRGHEFTADNTKFKKRPNGKFSRNCRTCVNAQRREQTARKRS